jgi:transcriptional regulator with XRE-family HTH domain
MSSILKGNLIRFLRERKMWTQALLSDNSGFESLNLSRLETNRHSPGEDIFMSLLYGMDLSVDTFFCFVFDNPNTKMFGLKNRLTYELFWCEHYQKRQGNVEEMIEAMHKTNNFDDGINKQYLLSCMAHLHMIQHKSPNKILDIVKEGITLTYDGFNPNDIQGDALLFNEPQLIHTLALAHNKLGDTGKAIQQLQQLKTGLTRLPQDDRAKETTLTPILLDLTKLLTETADYDTALELCETGNELSVKRNRGKYTPDFVFQKAKILHRKGQKKACAALLTPAYFGYSAMRLPGRANEVISFASKLSIEINTYGTENLPMDVPDLAVAYGESKPCNTFGMFIKNLRSIANITGDELCEGLCNPSVLYKLEGSDSIGIMGNVYLLEAFMQRLGRFIDSYFDTFMSLKDFEQKQIRNEINSLLSRKRYAEAEALLLKLASMKGFTKHNINKQFIKSAEAEIYGEKENKDDNKHMEMLLETLCITKPCFNERDIVKTRLTYYEIVTINQMANLICQQGDMVKGTRIFESLLASMDTNIVDEPERMRMYPTVLSNYTKFLGLMGAKEEALKLAIKGDEMCVKTCNLNMISDFAGAKGWNLCELGRKEECIPILAQIFYTSGLVNKFGNQKAYGQYTKERFGISFI